MDPVTPRERRSATLLLVASLMALIAAIVAMRALTNSVVTCSTRLAATNERGLPAGWRAATALAASEPIRGRATLGDLVIRYEIEEGSTPHTTFVRQIKLTDGSDCPAAEIDLAAYAQAPAGASRLEGLYRGSGNNIEQLRVRSVNGTIAVVTYVYPAGTSNEVFVVAVERVTASPSRALRAAAKRNEFYALALTTGLAIAALVVAVAVRHRQAARWLAFTASASAVVSCLLAPSIR